MRLPRETSEPQFNVLVAFPYFKRGFADVLSGQSMVRLLIDSGAFTAFQAGSTIELDDYCKFLETIPVKPWGYFALDVIGDPAATMVNYVEMVRRGFDPIPIFTRGTDPKVLEEYYGMSDIVGIGGLVKTPRNRGFVNGIMQHVGQRPVHLLGFSDLPFMKTYKPFSCDSSGWDNGSYGNIRLYMGHGQFQYIRRDNCKAPLPQTVQCRLLHYGVDPVLLAREDVWRGEKGINFRDTPRYLATIRSTLHAARDMEAMLGTKYFLATSSGPDVVTRLISSWKWMEKSWHRKH